MDLVDRPWATVICLSQFPCLRAADESGATLEIEWPCCTEAVAWADAAAFRAERKR